MTLWLVGVYLAVGIGLLLAPVPDGAAWVVWQIVQLLAFLGVEMNAALFVRVEFCLNVLLLVPLAGLGHLLKPRITWHQWTAYAFIVSGAFETAQALLLAERSASFGDVVANTLGGLVGALAAQMLWRDIEDPSAGQLAVGSSADGSASK